MVNKFQITLFLLFISQISFGQIISIGSGSYNQKPSSLGPTENLVEINEVEEIYSLTVDDLYSFKKINFGLTYSYMLTGAKVHFEHEEGGVVGYGTDGIQNHRFGLKLSKDFTILKRFTLRPYSLLSYEVNGLRQGSYTYAYGSYGDWPYEIKRESRSHLDNDQFVPTLGAELAIRIIRNVNLVFNYQYSWAWKFISDIHVKYDYFGVEQEELNVFITNTGSMMSFGLAWDLDYKHEKKSKNE